MNGFKKFLKSIDGMGREFKFKLEGSKFTTPLGGIFTLLILGGLLVFSYYFGIDMINKQYPITIEKNDIITDTTFHKVNYTNFFIGVRIENEDGQTMSDPRFVTYNFNFFSFVFDNSLKKFKEVEKRYSLLSQCTDEHIDAVPYQRHKLNRYFCTNIDYHIGGSWNENRIKYMHYFVTRCLNTTQNKNHCYSDEEIFRKFGRDFYINTFYLNNLYDPKNYNNPIVKHHEFRFMELQINRVNRQYFYFGQADLSTDSGILLQDWKKQKFLIFDHQRGNTASMKNNKIYDLSIYLTSKFTHYQRYYIKIPLIVAQVGGVFNLFLLIINKIWNLHIDNEFTVYLMKKLFRLENEETEAKKNNFFKDFEVVNNNNRTFDISTMKIQKNVELIKIPGKQHDIVDVTVRPFIDDKLMLEKNTLRNRQVEKIIEFKMKNMKEVEISSGKRLYFQCCCFEKKWRSNNSSNKIKYELMRACEEEIKTKTEVDYIFKNLDQFRLLKKLLLNESQCFMLENREKHCIYNTLEENDNDKKELTERLRYLKDEKQNKCEKDLRTYLKQRKNENNLNDIDNLLVVYLKKDIKEKVKEDVGI